MGPALFSGALRLHKGQHVQTGMQEVLKIKKSFFTLKVT